jgi:pyruvate formate-lyase activating enzyme-like uncharacterized protein
MDLSNFYILVDTETKQIINKIEKLPQNWKNIAGLPGLSDEELCDLEWAGQPNLGWVNIHSKKIKEYESSPENLELNKNEFKILISDLIKEKKSEPIEYCGAKLKSDNQTWNSLFILKEYDKVNYKCIDGYHTFTSSQITEIYAIITENIQKYFDLEMEIYTQIDSCQSISDFFNVKWKI